MITIANRRTFLAATAIAVGLLAAGCNSSAGPSQNVGTTSKSTTQGVASSSQSAAGTTITINDFEYSVSGSAASGSMVMITNNDSETHTVTADSRGGFDVTIQPGKTEMLTAPNDPGTYKFHCAFHATMHGALIVEH